MTQWFRQKILFAFKSIWWLILTILSSLYVIYIYIYILNFKENLKDAKAKKHKQAKTHRQGSTPVPTAAKWNIHSTEKSIIMNCKAISNKLRSSMFHVVYINWNYAPKRKLFRARWVHNLTSPVHIFTKTVEQLKACLDESARNEKLVVLVLVVVLLLVFTCKSYAAT